MCAHAAAVETLLGIEAHYPTEKTEPSRNGGGRSGGGSGGER